MADEGTPESTQTGPEVLGPSGIRIRQPQAGETFAGRYRIERPLGGGGMGAVYLATQVALGRKVAIKVLKPPTSSELDPSFDARFLKEAEAVARLQHPNTITVHDFGHTDDQVPYIVMEFVDGRDLRTAIAQDGIFSMKRSLHVAGQICRSLRDAHAAGMIHRDLKPANVLLTRRDNDDDFVKVLDFGLVKFSDEDSELTLDGTFLGSPKYTFPEALDRKVSVDQRADIYSTGILIYTMVTGEPPFGGAPMEVLSAHMHEAPQPMFVANPRCSTSPELEWIVARALEKSPDARFQSMDEFLVAFERLQGGGAPVLPSSSEDSSGPRGLDGDEQQADSSVQVVAGSDVSSGSQPSDSTTIARLKPRAKGGDRTAGPVLLVAAFAAVALGVAVAAIYLIINRAPSPPVPAESTMPVVSTPPEPLTVEEPVVLPMDPAVPQPASATPDSRPLVEGQPAAVPPAEKVRVEGSSESSSAPSGPVAGATAASPPGPETEASPEDPPPEVGEGEPEPAVPPGPQDPADGRYKESPY